MKRTIAIILSMVMLIACLAACGSSNSTATSNTDNPSNSSTDSSSNSSTETTKASDSNANVGVEAVVSEHIADKVVVISDQDLPDMSPWAPEGNGRLVTMPEVYEPLFTRLGFGGEFVGILAESYEQTGDQEFTIKIYENIYDSAGNHMTASDVEFSFLKAVELGNINKIATIADVEAVGEYTVKITWASTPMVDDFEAMMSKIFVVTQAAYEASPDGMVSDPVGTGAYIVTDYVGGNHVTMEAREDYWQDIDKCISPTQLQNVKVIEYDFVTEQSQRSVAMESGIGDLCATISSTDISKYLDGGAYSDTYDVYLYDDNHVYSLYYNCSEDSPLNDINLRKAISYAIDTAAIARSVYGDFGHALKGFATPVFGDYLDEWDSQDYYEYSIEKAQEYLAASNYSAGDLHLTILSSNAEAEINKATLVQAFLDAIGIDSTIESLAGAMYNSALADSTAWDICIATNAASAYITNVWLNSMLYTSFAWGGTKNFVFDDELQRLLAVAASREGHTDENVDAMFQYLKENIYIYGNCYINVPIVYNNKLISSVAQSYTNDPVPGGCTYIG